MAVETRIYEEHIITKFISMFNSQIRVEIELSLNFNENVEQLFIDSLKRLPTLDRFDLVSVNNDTCSVRLLKDDQVELVLTQVCPYVDKCLTVDQLESKIRLCDLARLNGRLGTLHSDGGLGEWCFVPIEHSNTQIRVGTEFSLPDIDFGIVNGKFMCDVEEIELLNLTRIL